MGGLYYESGRNIFKMAVCFCDFALSYATKLFRQTCSLKKLKSSKDF